VESNFKPEDLKSMLASYSRLLEKERDTAVKGQFEEFMEQIGIEDPASIKTYFSSFNTMLSTIDTSEMKLHEKLRLCIESDFFYEVLTAKTSNRERELRKITSLLSDFIQTSADNSGSDEQFIQSVLAQSLRSAAEMIEMDRDEQGSINEAWVEALRLGYDIFLGNPPRTRKL
jgi:DNA phosphorothioation-dependent restriction protein DptG